MSPGTELLMIFLAGALGGSGLTLLGLTTPDLVRAIRHMGRALARALDRRRPPL